MSSSPSHRHLLAVLFSLLLGGCFGDVSSYMKQAQGPARASVVGINKVKESGLSSGTFNPATKSAQMLSVDDTSEISGAAVTFPPGALAISVDITMQEGAAIATPALAGSLSIASGFQSTGVAVAITANQNLDAVKPFSVAIPLPTTAANLSLADLYENLVVTYVVTVAATGETRVGVIPVTSLRIENGKVAFETNYFGVFQAALTVEKIKEEIKSATTVLTVQTKAEQKAEQKALLPL